MAEMKTRRKRRAAGGKAETKNAHLYNAEGSPAAKSAMDDKADGFKKGGAAKRKDGGRAEHEEPRKHGGHVEGEHSKHRLDKRARGGRAMAAGGSPYTSAHAATAPTNKSSAGHEGEMPSGRGV